MKKFIVSVAAILMMTTAAISQKYFSKTGQISFFSHTPMEDIAAVSQSASTVLDASTGKIQWAVLIKSFEFKKALMQEHFNENYMESSTYPKAGFKGEITNMADINLTQDGTYTANLTGELEIRSVKKTVNTTASIIVKSGQISATSELKIKIADYGIEVPNVVRDNIAEEILIEISTSYEAL